MRLAIMNLLYGLFNFNMCYKESLGYNCKHGNHNGIKECDGSKI